MKTSPIAARILIIIAVFSAYLISCTSENVTPDNSSLDYFPLEVGSYIVYELDSTVYDDFNMVVNHRTMQVREIIESIFTDASGNESYRIERQYRNNENSNWGSVGYDIWFGSMENGNAERVEENQRYIKIVFPARVGKTWLGNIHINVEPEGPLDYLEDWEYEIKTLNESMTLNGMNFDSTMTIVEQAVGTVIDTVGSRAVYAKGIGVIFRELWVLESQCKICDPEDTACIEACQDSAWVDKAEKGFIVSQTILEYGNL